MDVLRRCECGPPWPALLHPRPSDMPQQPNDDGERTSERTEADPGPDAMGLSFFCGARTGMGADGEMGKGKASKGCEACAW